MQDAPDTLSICWCAAVAGEGAPARARELASFAHVVVVDPGSLDASALDGADIVVLDLDAFEGIHALVAAAARIDAPVLVRASADRIDGVLAELRTRDEASLDTDPASLLAHRLRRMHEAAAHQRDPLTGAATRVVFYARLERALADRGRPSPVSVLMVNIDHFKRINDERGHQAGDRILVALADRLALAIPADAVLARTGGETFAAILDVTAEDAAAIAERARLDVAERPFDVGDGPRVELTVSVGIATDAGDGSASELLRRADAALYAAKAHGRNRACHFSELAREIASRDGDIELENLENITRVVADRVTETIGVRTRRLFHEIREQADHDSLTGLPGRRYLDRRLPMEIDAANASDAPFTLALLDVDHFGDVNKEHGWPTGDRVLVEIATRVRRSVRATDWVARYGGEEISIALAGTTADQAAAVLERVREAVGDTPVGTGANGGPIHVTISIGAAQRQGPDETFGSLMERVSAKLLEAKRGGRNRVAL